MRLVAPHAAAITALSLVRDDELHARGLADDAACRPDAARCDVRDQATHADASDFLVVGEGEMQWALEAAAEKFGHQREAGRGKALHVRDAASVQPVALDGGGKGIGFPRLPVDRDDVGVS